MSLLRVRKSSLHSEEETVHGRLDILCCFAARLLPIVLASVCDRRMQGRGMEMPAMRRQARLTDLFIQPVAFGMFGFYLLWNVAWLWSGAIPPSILTAITGIPCPTTGGTRSLVAVLRGEWIQAILWNPLMPVYVGLLVYSATALGLQFIRRERLVLRRAVARFWMLALVMGWIAKLAIVPHYW
jgi:hypothetical protein